jgi:hypothetical protein
MELIDSKKYLFGLQEKFHTDIIGAYKNLSYDQNIIINTYIINYNNTITGILTAQIFLYNDINSIKNLVEEAANKFISIISTQDKSIEANIKNIVSEYTTSLTSHILVQSIFKYNMNFKPNETKIGAPLVSFIIDKKGDKNLIKKNEHSIDVKDTKNNEDLVKKNVDYIPIIRRIEAREEKKTETREEKPPEKHEEKKYISAKEADKLYNQFMSSIGLEEGEIKEPKKNNYKKLCEMCLFGYYCHKNNDLYCHIPKFVILPPSKSTLENILDHTKKYNDIYNISDRKYITTGRIHARLDICEFCLTASCTKLNDDRWHIPDNVSIISRNAMVRLYNELYGKRERPYYNDRDDKYKQFKR